MRRVVQVRNSGRLALAALGIALLGVPIASHSAELSMLDAVEKGLWILRLRDDGSEHRICVRDGRELIQIRHTQPDCSRFVVRDAAEEVVVQYTCRGNGYGRTALRREGSGLLQFQSQGIVGGAPFSISGEARHSGAC